MDAEVGFTTLAARRRFDGVWLLLVVLILAIHALRITALPLRGEETRRGQIAVEMIDSGDWLVPREQGLPFLSRPPLQNWLIGLLGMVRGQVDIWAIRLPSLMAILLVSLLIYGYGKTWMSRCGAFAAAIGFATMGQVLELGTLGETESLFTLFVSGSLLVWHWGVLRRWPEWTTWCAAYALAALGVLTKGPQAPAYFAAAVGVFLLLRREVRFALTWQHAAGIAFFLSLWGAWQWPFLREMGLDGTRAIYGGDVAMRFADTRWTTVFKHLATFPFEVLGCLLPWSLLLGAFFHRKVRQLAAEMREPAIFLCVALAVTFPTVWLPPGSRGRYYMPLYPCLALLAGLAVDRLLAASQRRDAARDWRRFVFGMSAACLLGAAAFLTRACGGLAEPLRALPPAAAACGAFAGFLLAATLWRLRSDGTPRGFLVATACAATMLGLAWNGLMVPAKLAFPGILPEEAVARLKETLPANVRLASIGEVDHVFAFHYGAKIRRIDLREGEESWPDDVDYVCYSPGWDGAPTEDAMPRPFEELMRISCRAQRGAADRVLVVGRRSAGMARVESPTALRR